MLIRTVVCVTALCAAAPLPGYAQSPKTAKKAVTDEYHGVKVVDDYRWLEDWNDKAVKDWSDAQNVHARKFLDGLKDAPKIRERIGQLLGQESPDYHDLASKGGQLFALKFQPPKQQGMLVVMPSADEPEKERVVVDPNAIDKEGGTTIDWYVPSADGSLVAVSMSTGGSEAGDVHVYDAATGEKLEDVVPRVHGGTAGGSLAWDEGGSGFYYTRYPRGNEREGRDKDFYQQVYHHLIGTPTENDKYEVGKDFPRIAEILLDTSDDGKYVVASVQNGDGGEFAHYIRIPSDAFSMDRGTWRQVTKFTDGVKSASLRGSYPYLTLMSVKDAPRGKIGIMQTLMGDLASTQWIVPEQDFVIDSFRRSPSYLWVIGHRGGPSEVQMFDVRGEVQGFISLPPFSTVGGVELLNDGNALMQITSFLEPPAWYHVSNSDVTPRKSKLAKSSPADFSDCEVVRETATSKDGTKVPLTIVRKKGTKLDGSNPTLLWGYGGYGVVISPTFSEPLRLWLDQGGVYALATIRGGGEFGDQWHLQGNLERKQNVFDDFAACMTTLVDLKYTTPDKLAIEGGSNGGLLMGAMITQHPEKFRVCVSHVGIYDMLRVELSSNGEFNITEFGTVKDKKLFDAMYAYSPYHRVKDGTKYPSILMMTGANDPRVDPMQSRKMIARLQAASASKNPVLLRTSANAGHGIGSSLSQRIERHTDRFAFLMQELGMSFKAK
jgi:prolyl oligopeptidase